MFKKRLYVIVICVLLLTLTGCIEMMDLIYSSHKFSITLDTTENISKTGLSTVF